METEISVKIDPYEVFDNMRCEEQVEFVADVLSNMSPYLFTRVIELLDKEEVITCFTANQICDYVDEQELVDELTHRGWKLADENE